MNNHSQCFCLVNKCLGTTFSIRQWLLFFAKKRNGLLTVVTATMLLGFTSKPLIASPLITVEIEPPEWSFVLKQNGNAGGGEEVSSKDRQFIKQLQPLIDAEQYQKVITEFEAEPLSQYGPHVSALYAQVLLTQKHYKKAHSVLLKTVERLPRSANVHRSLSMTSLMLDDLKRARTHLIRSIELGVNDAQLYGQLGYANLQLSQPVAAINAYQSALMLDPENAQWQQGLLYAFIQSNALAQAESLLNNMLQERNADSSLWLQRGQIALKRGNHTKAIGSLETALSLGDTSQSNLLTVAQLHLRDGSVHRAAALLTNNVQALLSRTPSNAVNTIMNVASTLVLNEQWEQLETLLNATKPFQKKLTRYEAASLSIVEARMAAARQKQDKAIDLLEKAIDSAPDNGEAVLALARLYHDKNQYNDAMMFYLRAEALPNTHLQGMLGRAQIAIDEKRYHDALPLLRKAYKNNPSQSGLLSNIQTLEALVKRAS